jgi:hypothetical protein
MQPPAPTRVVGAFAAFVIVGASLASAQTDPRTGHWKINLAKSTFDPGPAPKSDVRTYEVTADGTKATVEQTPASGSPATITYTAKLDGKDYPISGSPTFDTIAIKRIDGHITQVTLKKGGKLAQTVRAVVSNDGKTMTNTVNGTDANGRKVHDVVVFDKQP